MTIKIHVQTEAVPHIRAMAQEAGVGLHDICEIAVYNLVALWIRERMPEVTVDANDGLVPDRKLGCNPNVVLI